MSLPASAVWRPGVITWAMDPGLSSWFSLTPLSSVPVFCALPWRVESHARSDRLYALRHLLTVLSIETPPDWGEPSEAGADGDEEGAAEEEVEDGGGGGAVVVVGGGGGEVVVGRALEVVGGGGGVVVGGGGGGAADEVELQV